MFQAKNVHRQHARDLKLAAMLSVAAGSVNSAGFFAFDVLTTNVTGHVALLANDIVASNSTEATTRGIWMLAFLFGAFISGFLVTVIGRAYPRFAFTIPLILEITILALVGYFGNEYYDHTPEMMYLFAGSTLLAMGLQNALVTILSGSVVRTTHLTGLFTDLGINLSKFLTIKKTEKKEKTQLYKKLFLQFTIIGSFISGGIVGAYLFANYLFYAYIFPLCVLIIAMSFDILVGKIQDYGKKIIDFKAWKWW